MGLLNKVSKAYARFEQTYERKPSPEELAEMLDLSEEKVPEVLRGYL